MNEMEADRYLKIKKINLKKRRPKIHAIDIIAHSTYQFDTVPAPHQERDTDDQRIS